MDASEAQSKSLIASALIVRGAVEIPSMPCDDAPAPDRAGQRLRDLTDYVYRLITTDEPEPR